MESFESLVALAMQAENLVVAGPTKFKINQQTKKAAYAEFQTHGYEVDVVGIRQDKLVLASVKSFFGSGGVKGKELVGNHKGYKMLNDVELRTKMVEEAARTYGFRVDQVEMRFYAGKFSSGSEAMVRDWCETQIAGGSAIQVFNLIEVIETVEQLAKSKTYIDDPALVAIKAKLIADEFRAKMAAAEAKALGAQATLESKAALAKKLKFEFEVTPVARQFPVGSRVHATTGDVRGVVIGYSQQHSKTAYVKIREDETNNVFIRSANTCTSID